MIKYDDLCTLPTLYKAWETIKEKSAAGGIDGVSVKFFEEQIEANLQNLTQQLIDRKYIPEPYKEIKIPKDKNECAKQSL